MMWTFTPRKRPHQMYVIRRLNKVVRKDWKNSRALDLTDKALRKELGRHGLECESHLAIEPIRKKYAGETKMTTGQRQPRGAKSDRVVG